MDRRNFIKYNSFVALGGLADPIFAQGNKPITIAFFVKNVTNPFGKDAVLAQKKPQKN